MAKCQFGNQLGFSPSSVAKVLLKTTSSGFQPTGDPSQLTWSSDGWARQSKEINKLEGVVCAACAV